jgi:hypothetical protein
MGSGILIRSPPRNAVEEYTQHTREPMAVHLLVCSHF